MKLAALFGTNVDGCSPTLHRMLQAQISRAWHTSHAYTCQAGGFGYVRTSDTFSTIPLAHEAENGNRLLIAGVPLDLNGPLDERLKRIVGLEFAAGIRELQSLDGAFAAFLWNEAEKRFAIVTDILGMQPLYIYRSSGVLLLASEVKGVTATGLIRPAMDFAAWGAFLSFRHMIADRTLVESVTGVPAASVLIYDPGRDHLSGSTYWNWPEPAHVSRLEELPVDQLMEVFFAEIDAFRQHNSNALLCLSGGYDSRLILASLFRVGAVPKTISLSHADDMFDLDAKLAARIARKFRAAFSVRHPNPEFFSSEGYVKYLLANEVATPSLYLFIAQLCDILQPEMQAIWEGVFPGCILFPIHQPPGPFESYLRRECAPFDAASWRAAERVFHPNTVKQMREAFSDCLEQEKRRYTNDEFGVSQFVVRNRTRHRIATNPMQVYSNDVLPFTPGISKTFWSIAASIPYSLKQNHTLYQYIFQEYFPPALTVPAVSGSTIYRLEAAALQPHLLLAKLAVLIKNNWRVSLVLRKFGMAQGDGFWKESTLVGEALRSVNPAHTDLNSDEVRKLQTAQPPISYISDRAKDLLFYWHFWRQMLHDSEKGSTFSSLSLVENSAR